MSRNSIVLITGGTGNVGVEVVRFLLKCGHKIYCTCIVKKELDNFNNKEKQDINFIYCDLTSKSSSQECIDTITNKEARLDVLINLVGGFQYKEFAESTLDDAIQMMNINYFSVFNICNLSIKALSKSDNPKIINMGAVAGEVGYKNMSAYSASKAALINLSKTLSKELEALKIKVTCVLPNTIDTKANRDSMPNEDHSKWVRTSKISSINSDLTLENSTSLDLNLIKL